MNKKYILIAIAVVGLIIIFFSGNGMPGISREYSSTDTEVLTVVKPMETVELKNGDPYNLTASYVKKNINGVEYKMLSYNGSIPGPMIKVEEGAEVTINFKNDTDMNTLLHSHGVRMDNAFDGSQTTQKEIKPEETFFYKLKFPDPGMYWYHPHVREDFEQELGLYGNFLVTSKDSNYWNPVNREVALFLDDILIENGSINLSKQSADHTLMGRYGNVMLLNGETDYTLSLKKGEVVRFYITNAANARPFNLAIADTKLKLVGADGGAYEKEEWRDSVIIGPSERAIVEVLFDKNGKFVIQNKILDRTYALGALNVSEDSIGNSHPFQFNQLGIQPLVIQSIDPFRQYFNKVPDKRIKLTLDMGGEMMNMGGGHMMPDGTIMGGGGMVANSSKDGIEWEDDMAMMNQISNTDSIEWKIVDEATGFQNMKIDWVFKRGEPVKIRIENDRNSMHPMQHPIHFHGQRFLVLERDGIKQTNLAWKDTVLIPSGERVDILLDTSNPGTWMAHCHIAEHLESGMMMKFVVE